MSAPSLLQRLGLAGERGPTRLAWGVVALGVAFYALGYVSFYPRAITNDDEGLYLEQTGLWVETGSFRAEKLDPLSGEPVSFVPGDYPVGMVALMAPFVKAFGWRGGFVPSFLCLLIAVLVTARWLHDERRSPVLALILLAFPAALVGGRLAMSDTARTAIAATGLWLFFRGLDREPRRSWWLASGFLAGAALSLRESAVLPFIPLFAGTVVRRDRGWLWLLLGGLAGTGLHLVTNQLGFGDAFFVRGTQNPYPLELAHLHQRLPLYLLGLLVFVPGGLAFGLAYRGRRRPELLLTLTLFFLFYALQAFGAAESGFLKSLVIGLRYFDPLLPVLAFMLAESMPRGLEALLTRLPNRVSAERLAAGAVAIWVAGALAAAFAVHPALDRWSASQAEIRDTIEENVPADAVLVTNGTALRKFIDDVARPYVTLFRDDLSAENLERLRETYGGYVVVLLDRSDSSYWREDVTRNAAFVSSLGDPVPFIDLRVTATDRLRIWRIGEPRPASPR